MDSSTQVAVTAENEASEPQSGEERTQLGTFAPGNKVSKGRRKGSKNKATILRETMTNKTNITLSKKTPKVLKVVLEAAIKGDLQAAKMILDRTIPIRKATEGDEEKNNVVQVVINNLTRENVDERMGRASRVFENGED